MILGGGRRGLQPRASRDVEEGKRGARKDGKDLIQAWKDDKTSRGFRNNYVWNKQQLMNTDFNNTDYLMGKY